MDISFGKTTPENPSKQVAKAITDKTKTIAPIFILLDVDDCVILLYTIHTNINVHSLIELCSYTKCFLTDINTNLINKNLGI